MKPAHNHSHQRQQRKPLGHLDRARLPKTAEFYERELDSLKGAGTWRDALCPFHGDKHPSMRVNVQTGAYKCFACGEGGSDLIAYLRRRDGLSFPDACRRLGAWVEEE
jgi:DNA primase